MSKFFKALEQASRDRALRTEPPAPPAPVAAAGSPPPAPAPYAAAGRGDHVDEHLVSLVTPATHEAEQYRSLRHTIEHLHRTEGLKVLAVSSPGMGDGKSLTAINLAGALAQAPENRVLLVDADLRRPAVGRLLGVGIGGEGLVDAILDPAVTLDQVVQPRPPFNLSVISAGQTPPSPYEVLKSPRLGDLLDAARRQYDFVVIDTPPLAPVQDCRVIGRWVDGFLVVVAAHRTPRRLLEEALGTLDQSKVIGIVFNQDDRRLSRHYSGYYGGYYAASRPSPNGGAHGAWKRAVAKVGDSLRRRGR